MDSPTLPGKEPRDLIRRTGIYAAAISFVAAAGYCVVQLLQVLGFLSFPYDQILIYAFSLGIAPPFLLAMLAFFYTGPLNGIFLRHAALLFALLYTLFACFVYPVQLAVVIPMQLRGQEAAIRLLVQSPHSLFWTLDALAYVFMGISTLFGAFALRRIEGARWLHAFFLGNGLMVPLILLVYLYPRFSNALLMIASPWALSCPGSLLLLSFYFARRDRPSVGEIHGLKEQVAVPSPGE